MPFVAGFNIEVWFGTWMVSVTLVAALPAAIVCGEKAAVAPAGRPDDVKLIAA